MVLLHLGALHPFETFLTLLLAFGPFVVLGVVIWRRRREDDEAPPGGAVERPLPPSRSRPDGGPT